MQYFGNDAESGLQHYHAGRLFGAVAEAGIDFKHLADTLDCSRSFHQVGIIYDDDQQRWLVRPSPRGYFSRKGDVSHVVITKVQTTFEPIAAKAFVSTLQSPSLLNEITATALSCGAILATISLGFFLGTTIPFTAGASGVIAAMITAGIFATTAQCAIGVTRLAVITTGDEDNVAWLDRQTWYLATCTALDILSLAGASASLKRSLQTYRIMKASSPAKALNWLKGLSRSERKRLTSDIIRAHNPGISNAGIKAAINAGSYPKRFPAEALQRALQKELASALINTSAFAGSAASGTLRHPNNISQSGKYIIGFLQPLALLRRNSL